jgi:hypothetical protein
MLADGDDDVVLCITSRRNYHILIASCDQPRRHVFALGGRRDDQHDVRARCINAALSRRVLAGVVPGREDRFL